MSKDDNDLWFVTGIAREGSELSSIGMGFVAPSEEGALGRCRVKMHEEWPQKEVLLLWAGKATGLAQSFTYRNPDDELKAALERLGKIKAHPLCSYAEAVYAAYGFLPVGQLFRDIELLAQRYGIEQ